MTAQYTDKTKQAVLGEYLVIRCQGGDANALQELMKHWHVRLYGFALGQLQDPEGAKEATQESLASISAGIHRLQDPASFPKWAYQIVIRRCADWQRREVRWRTRHVTNSGSAIADAAAPPMAGSGNDIEGVQRAIRLLEPELRDVVRLHYFESFSMKEIGELLTLPIGTVKSRLYYARKKLKQTIGEEQDD